LRHHSKERMTIEPVLNDAHKNQFLEYPLKLYKDHDYWIRPLDKDISNVFDVQKNPIAKEDNFMRWLLFDTDRKIIGRIAAFINPKTKNKHNDYPVAGIGFFECINDQLAANLLFDTAKEWLKTHKIEAMEGPINFGNRDKWWGLLVAGFDKEPNYLANYNFPYYQDLFENYGFKCYFNQFSFSRVIKDSVTPEYEKNAARVFNNPDFSFQHIQIKNLPKYTEEFRVVYNKAWVGHMGVSEMNPSQAKSIIDSLKPVFDKHTSWFAYYKGKPIAFFIAVPEVNQVFKKVNGKLNLLGKYHFIKSKLFKTNKKLMGIIFGVIPEFDGQGVTQAISLKAKKQIETKTNYQTFEFQGIGDFNPAMLKFVAKLGVRDKSKIHTTYRYLFNQNQTFKRMPIKSKFVQND